MRSFIRAFLLMTVAVPAQADTAMVVGSVDTSATTSYGAPRYVGTALQPLDQAGFDVISAFDADTDTLRGLVSQMASMGEEDRLVIILAGRFANFGGLTWFLGRDAGVQDLGSVSGAGIPVQLLLDIASQVDGGAIILLGPEDQGVPMGIGLADGLGTLEVPEGVTLAAGHPAAIARFASRELLVPGRPIRDAFARTPGLNVVALNEPFAPFVPAPIVTPTIPPADQSYWEAMAALNNVFAYRAYLNRYPNGYYAAEARSRVDALAPPTPQLTPQEVESALGLSRNQKRDIQRDLAVLSYYTNAIDGLFGPGSRGAIRGWQQANGLPVTGYLDASQIQRLSDQGDVRRAQVQAQDRAYWQQTGGGNNEAGMRAYLDRYPHGEFAELARERIAAMEEARAEQADSDYWNQTGRGIDEAGLRAYLQRYPNGQFSNLARQRLANIEAAQDRNYWQQTGAGGTEAGLRAYLQRYPDGDFAHTARQQLNALTSANNQAAAWQAAQAANTISAYQQYINAYPNSPNANVARGRIADIETAEDRAYWQQTGAAGTEAGLRAYLQRYPNGDFAQTARQQLNALTSAGNEAAAWQAAQAADTIDAYRQFLNAYPSSPNANAAQRRISEIRGDDLAWQQAQDTDTADAYRDYLNAYPNGRNRGEARAALEAIRAENLAWRDASNADTAQSYQLYLEDYPDGRFARQARDRLSAMSGGGAPVDPAVGQMSRAQLQLAATNLRRIGLLPQGNVTEADIVEALRRYQRSRGLNETGLMDRQTTVMLLGEALIGGN
jgi:outer membrane protein assembly factor BamD (BamD/ComL family)